MPHDDVVKSKPPLLPTITVFENHPRVIILQHCTIEIRAGQRNLERFYSLKNDQLYRGENKANYKVYQMTLGFSAQVLIFIERSLVCKHCALVCLSASLLHLSSGEAHLIKENFSMGRSDLTA